VIDAVAEIGYKELKKRKSPPPSGGSDPSCRVAKAKAAEAARRVKPKAAKDAPRVVKSKAAEGAPGKGPEEMATLPADLRLIKGIVAKPTRTALQKPTARRMRAK
jgi:predicted flap endonuclease-1-like 5' DNA nuclease